MVKFNSRIIRAGNIERQAKRITAFGDIKENKKGKVIQLSFDFPDHDCQIVERKF